MLFIFFEILLAIGALAVLIAAFRLLRKLPSLDRDWSPDQKILPSAEFKASGKIIIRNIRHVSYQTAKEYTVSYYDREFDLDKLKKVWFFLVHFTGYRGAGHSFLSFEFEDDVFIAISIEIRKKRGESYSAMKGLFRQFEIMYVIADERDVVRLRTDHHKDNVFLYPLKLSKERSQALFCDMLKRSNAIAQTPEFYHSVSNACFKNIVDHINNVLPGKMPFDYRIIFPENADRYAHALDLIDTNLPISEARKKHLINPFAEKYADDPDFSQRIREGQRA
ncbi:MAG: DUF4105 domain-containing protein [Candidatus Paceibacterota bacterium]|jgi:hypothetical protein|nr:DUF4105 domain-containing protein [Candidatus Paceibacterota bacterium]